MEGTPSKYRLYHLHELETALNELDTDMYPNEAEEIKAFIISGGYHYPEHEVKTKRPLLITLLVIIGMIGIIVSIPLVNSFQARNIGAWYPYFLSASILISFISHIGFWMMRKWAIYLYIGLIVFAQIVLITMNLWTPESLIEPSIVIAILLSYLSRMK